MQKFECQFDKDSGSAGDAWQECTPEEFCGGDSGVIEVDYREVKDDP